MSARCVSTSPVKVTFGLLDERWRGLTAGLVLNVTFVAFNRYLQPPAGAAGSLFAGQVFALFVITVAAAEAALGLAIVIAVYRLRHTVQVDEFDLLRG